jgi:hypothetical protein
LVIGPIRPEVIETFRENQTSFDELRFATWPALTRDESLILDQVRKVADVSFAELDIANLEGYSRLPFQVATTQAGLAMMTSEVIVRCRSDEFYNLNLFLNSVASEPDKIWFSNFIVRPWSYHPFHVSDHLFAAEAMILRSAFSQLSGSEAFEISRILGPKHMIVPESRIGLALFNARLRHEGIEWWTSGAQATSRETFEMFIERFQLHDLDSSGAGSYRLNANNAGISGANSVSQLGEPFGALGAPIDFVHFRKIQDLKPRSIAFEWLMRKIRYTLRVFFPSLTTRWNRNI